VHSLANDVPPVAGRILRVVYVSNERLSATTGRNFTSNWWHRKQRNAQKHITEAKAESVYIKIVRLLSNVGDRAYAMSHAERLAAGRGTGIGLQRIGLQHVNDVQCAQRDKPRRV